MSYGRKILGLGLACAALALAPPALADTTGETLDASFGANGHTVVALGSSFAASAVAIQSDGKIVTAGEVVLNRTHEIAVTRMNSNGSLDSTFGRGGIVTVNINGSASVDSGAALAIEGNGDIVAVGTGNDWRGDQFAAVRLLPNGFPDRSFGSNGIASVTIGSGSIANAVAVQPDGKIVLGGVATMTQNEFAVARLNGNGTIDNSFGSRGYTTFPQPGCAWAMALQSNGDIVLGGEQNANNTQEYMAARVTPNGAPDSSFGTNGVVTVPIGQEAFGDALAIQPNGQIILAGSAYTATSVAAAVRLNADGSLDTGFGASGIASVQLWQAVNAIALQPDGKILLTATGATTIRLNIDGTADTSFGPGGAVTVSTGSSSAANGIAVQPSDGRIVLAGTAAINGTAELAVFRLQAS